MSINKFELFILPVSVTSILILLFFFLRAITFKLLHRYSEKTKTNIDDVIIQSIKGPSLFWSIALALYIGLHFLKIPKDYVIIINKFIFILIIASVTFVLSNLLSKLFKYYTEKSERMVPATGLANATIKGIVLIIGGLLILNGLGISITPLITALGVGGLAVALALQDTLTNLFAGIHIMMERSVRVGDFIKIESGEQGYVQDITWRTTRIRMLPNNMVIIPNSKLSQSIITNYYLPEQRMSLLIPIGVSYSADPEHVERVLLEEARKAAEEIPGLLSEPEPFVRFIPGFGESSLDFTLICQVKEFVDQYYAQHELRKRIFKRFKEEGIEIPFPHRTVYLREEKNWQ